jgi:signal transduction histidine kinase
VSKTRSQCLHKICHQLTVRSAAPLCIQRTEAIRAEQIRLLYANAPAGFVATVLNAILLTLTQWPVIAAPVILSWLAAMLTLTLLRALLVWQFQRRRPDSQAIGPWGTLFGIGTGLAGIGWGAAGIVLFPVTSMTHQVFLAFVLGGMIAGAVGLLSARMHVFLSFAGPAALPVIVHLFIQDNSLAMTMAGMAALFTSVMIFTAWKLHGIILSSVHLRFDNADLVASVTAEKERVDHLNTQLIAEIAERKQAEAERQALQQQLMETSRRAGMADVAVSVLHNVGNVLNSINVASSLIVSTIRASPLSDLSRIATMLQEHASTLGDYLTRNPQGQQIPGYLSTLAAYLTEEQATMLTESEALRNNVEHIQQIIDMQQSLARFGGMQEPVLLAEMMEQALAINLAALEHQQVEVIREYGDLSPMMVDRHQVLQILVNLISNATHAMQACPGRPHCLTLRIGLAKDREGWVRLQVHDTGIGIKPEYVTRIFSQGFTTKRDGHGLGLHSSAVVAKLMGGTLKAQSPGEDYGATFTLALPIKRVEARGGSWPRT